MFSDQKEPAAGGRPVKTSEAEMRAAIENIDSAKAALKTSYPKTIRKMIKLRFPDMSEYKIKEATKSVHEQFRYYKQKISKIDKQKTPLKNP